MGGGMIATPFVISDSVVVSISGFDQEGVDCGFYGYAPADEENIRPASIALKNKAGEIGYISYEGNMAMPISFTALNDACNVLAVGFDNEGNQYPDLNILRVSADGQTCNVDGQQFSGVTVYTATNWFDGDMNEYYGIAGMADDYPEWVESIIIDDSQWASQENTGANLFMVKCAPLPEGVTSRQCEFYLQGRGVVSAEPIKIIQGEGAYNSIENVNSPLLPTSENSIYNLSGQRVNKSTRGIIIKDGKKIARK